MEVGERSGASLRDFSTCVVRFDDRPSYKYRTAQLIRISRRTAIVLIIHEQVYSANFSQESSGKDTPPCQRHEIFHRVRPVSVGRCATNQE